MGDAGVLPRGTGGRVILRLVPGNGDETSERARLPGTTLAVAVVVALLVGSVVAAVAVWRNYRADLDDAIGDQARLAFESAADSSQYLRGRLDVLATFATRPSFASGDVGAIAGDLDAFPGETLGIDGGIAWYRPDGTLVASQRPTDGPTDAAVRAVVEAAADGPSVSPVRRSGEFDGDVILLAVPTHGAVGTVEGVLVAGIRTAWLDEIATRLGEARGTDSYVFDREGTMIAGTPGPTPFALPDVAELPGARTRSTVVYAASDGATDPSGRDDRVLGFAFEGTLTGWTSVEARSEADAFAPARRSLARTVLALAAVAAVLLIGTALVARRLNRLARETRDAERAAAIDRARAAEDATRLQLALSATSTGWFQWSEGSTQLNWSPVVAALARDGQETPPDTLDAAWAMVDAADRPAVERAMSRAMANGGPAEVEFRLADTSPARWVWLYVSPVTGPEARPRQLVGLVRDVTERRSALQQLVELATREHDIAETLQRSLLPSTVPRLDGIEIATRYRAAGPDAVIGGDFYDVIALGEGSHAIAIGDVCGRGITVASITALARHTLRAGARYARHPDEALRWLHDALLGADVDGFVTCVAGRGAVHDGIYTLELAVGGHPLPILRSSDGTTTTIGRPGTLLGIVPPALHLTRHDLRVGDRLVLYTDGLTDSSTPRLDDDDVRRAVEASGSQSAEELADGLLAMSSPAGGRQHDDTAILVLDVTGPLHRDV